MNFKPHLFQLLGLVALSLFSANASADPTFGSPPGPSLDPGCHYVDTRHYHVELNADQPYGLNNSGAYVGMLTSFSGAPAYYQGAKWARGQFTSVGGPVRLRPVSNPGTTAAPSALYSATARAVNNEPRPVVVGYGRQSVAASGTAATVTRAFLWQPSSMTALAGGLTAISSANLSPDPTVSLGQYGAISTVASLRNTFALSVSDPIVDRNTGALIGKRIAVGSQSATSISTPDFYPETGRLALQNGMTAVYWDLGNAASASVASPMLVPLPAAATSSEARAVNSVGTIAGSYMVSGKSQAFVATYPYASAVQLPLLNASHTAAYATSVNDFGTTASGLIGANGPGQVFGYSMAYSGSTLTSVEAVVWKYESGAWTVTALIDAGVTSRPRTLVSAAGSRGVVAGMRNGIAYIYRDGRDPFSVTEATKAWSRGGTPVAVSFNSVRAMNNNGDIIAMASSGRAHVLRPTYYDIIELPLPSAAPGVTEHSPRAVAVTEDGAFAVGYSLRCGTGYTACAYLASGLPDSAVGDPHALLWKISPDAATPASRAQVYSLSSRRFSLPTAIAPSGDVIGGRAGSSAAEMAATRWTGSWGPAGASYSEQDMSNEFGINSLISALSKNDFTHTLYEVYRVETESVLTDSPVSMPILDALADAEMFARRENSDTAVTVNEINAAGQSVGQSGATPTYWESSSSPTSLATLFGASNTRALGLNVPLLASSAPCGSIPNAAACERQRRIVVGDGMVSPAKRAFVWTKTAAGWSAPRDASLTVSGSVKDSMLNKVNGIAQAVGNAASQFRFLIVRRDVTQYSTMLSFDQFNADAPINQMAFAMPPDSDFLLLSEGADIDEFGDVVGWGYRRDGKVGAFFLRVPSLDDPACWSIAGTGAPLPG